MAILKMLQPRGDNYQIQAINNEDQRRSRPVALPDAHSADYVEQGRDHSKAGNQ